MKHKTTTTPANNPGKAAGPAETVPPSTEKEMGKYPSLTEIKELIEFVSKKEFNEFELERGGFRMRWRKGAPEPAPHSNRQPVSVPQPAGENRPVEFVPPTPAEPSPKSSSKTASRSNTANHCSGSKFRFQVSGSRFQARFPYFAET